MPLLETPRIIYFLKIRKKINNGTVANNEPVILAGVSLLNSPVNWAIKPLETKSMLWSIPIWDKTLFLPEAISVGQMKAFHAPIKERIKIVTIVGIAIGIIHFHKYWKCPYPSTLAARNSSLGICWKV